MKDVAAGLMTFLFCTIQSVSFGASIEEGAPQENLFGKVRMCRVWCECVLRACGARVC